MIITRQQLPPQRPLIPADAMPTTQDIAIVLCGGGDPFAELELAKRMVAEAGKKYSIFAGNDMIERCPDDIDHALTLHPDKLPSWLSYRKRAGFNDPPRVWAHRPFGELVTHWTKDWSGSTGLLCTKVARECGYTHIVLCGVPMTVEANHFVRQKPWNAAHGFRRGWSAHQHQLKHYVRSFNGWTQELFGAPTVEWLRTDQADGDRRYPEPVGLKA
jgi:hypothetical protein